jgi:hypothetical protein
MELRSFARAYARSPLGIGSFLLAAGGGLAALLLGLGAALAVLAAAAFLGLFFILALALGGAQRAAQSEAGREFGAKAEARLAEVSDARRRLAALRLADSAVAGARDLVVLEAGRLVEDCSRAHIYDPEAVQAVLDSLSLVDAWLKEADSSSVEKRFDLPDADPFPEAARRTADALRAKAAAVAAGRARATGEIPPSDTIAIDEELK